MQHDPQGAHKDPVCGMTVNENSQHQFVHAGQTYYFCCDSCKQKFSKNPQTYLNPEQAPAAKPVAKDAIYICPMDPEIEQIGPGICPICGMALEPKEAIIEEDNSELLDMSRRLKISIALSLPLLLLTMGDMLPGISFHDLLGMRIFDWLQFALATPVVVWLGRPFLNGQSPRSKAAI
jgi:YHS domain-containing protein